MARRWRVNLASSPKVLGVVTAAALIIALLITSRSLNGGGGPGPPAPTASRGPANSQAPYKITGKAASDRGRSRLLPDSRQGHQRRLSARATARRDIGGRRRLPNPDQPQLPCKLPAGRRPARLRGALPWAAAHHPAWPATTQAVPGAVELPARGAARVHPGRVRGPRGLRRRPRHAALRRPGDLGSADRRGRQPTPRAVPERAPDRHPDRAPHPGGAGRLP